MTIYVGSCGGGGTSLDRFAPKYLVGNTANGDTASVAGLAPGFQYFPDPGDGSGIAAALAAALAAPGDVQIRPGTYDLQLGGSPSALVIPTGVKVRGAGPSTIITGRVTGNQTIITLGVASELEDVRVNVIGVFASPTNVNPGVIQAGGGLNAPSWLRRVDVQLQRQNPSVGPTRCAVYVASGTVRVENCRFFLEGNSQDVGGVCAVFADGLTERVAQITQCIVVRVSSSYDSAFAATEAANLYVSESTILNPSNAGVLTSASTGAVLVAECVIRADAGGAAVSVDSTVLQLTNSRLGSLSGAPTGAALVSTCTRGVVSGNQINGNVNTAGGTNHIIVTNLVSAASVVTPNGSDEIAHNITY